MAKREFFMKSKEDGFKILEIELDIDGNISLIETDEEGVVYAKIDMPKEALSSLIEKLLDCAYEAGH